MGVCPGLSPCQGLPLARDNEATGTNLGMRGVSPTPTVLTQNSRRAFPQDYKPIALRVGLQYVGRTLGPDTLQITIMSF